MPLPPPSLLCQPKNPLTLASPSLYSLSLSPFLSLSLFPPPSPSPPLSSLPLPLLVDCRLCTPPSLSPPLSSSLPPQSRAANAVTALPSVAASLKRCLCRSADAATALPTLPPRCRRRRRAAATALPPPSPPLCRRRHCRPVTLLPRCLLPLSCCCEHRAADAVTTALLSRCFCRLCHRTANGPRRCLRPFHCCLALPTPSLHCPPSPLRCHAAFAALMMLPPRFEHCRHVAAAVAVLPPPLCHRRCCRLITLLPCCLSPLSCRR